MAANQVSVGAAIRYAWSLLSANFRAIWGVLALNALASTVLIAGQLSRNDVMWAAAMPAVLMTTLMTYGALYRLALADRHGDDPGFKPGHHGLQWGAMEWRMLAARLLVVVFIVFLALLATLLIGSVLVGVLQARGFTPTPGMTSDQLMAALGPAGRPLSLAVAAALLVLVTWLSLRLGLALPASADEKAVRVLRTWKLTRGQVWPLFAATALVQLPVLFIGGYVVLNVLAMSGGPADAGPTAILIAALVLAVPAGLFVTPMQTGIFAHFYRTVAPASGRPPPAVKPRP